MKTINFTTLLIAAVFLVLGAIVGALLFGGQDESQTATVTNAAEGQIWTCSMHPQIRQNEPGDCPICGMDLIPLEEQESGIDPNAIKMSATAIQLANIQTAVVGSTQPVKTVELSGKVQADERLISTQSAHIPGRIEQLEVSFTGEFVDRGQTIARVYSPALATAQEELFEARKVRETHPELYKSAREKLKNWKISDVQIDQILTSGEIKENFPVQATISGFVTKKMVNTGDYVTIGQPLFQIADLSKVWVLFDVYESDLPWVDVGDSVHYSIQSLPGESFRGIIDYVDPTIDPRTRVARARVVSNNPSLRLKPEMFATGQIKTGISGPTATIVVPKSAVMWTGKRSVVYVQEVSEGNIQFKMREVILGPALGDAYVIESGLKMGEEIAVHGTFSIDAAAQLAGKPSMMSDKEASPPQKLRAEKIAPSSAVHQELQPLFGAYFELKDRLVSDDEARAQKSIDSMKRILADISMSVFEGTAHDVWMNHSNHLEQTLTDIESDDDIEKIRRSFIAISDVMIASAQSFGANSSEVYVQFCPMADDNNGADWLSRSSEIRNPYFGSAMLKCGEVKDTILFK